MSVYKTKSFTRFLRKERIPDGELKEAARDVIAGRIDADLGGGVIKQRIARTGAGKSGGYRTIVLFKSGTRLIFAYGFAKSSRANISKDELAAFRMLADRILGFTADEAEAALVSGELIEVDDVEKSTE